MHIAETNIKKENDNYKHIQELINEPDISIKLEVIRQVGDITKLLIKSVFEDEIRSKAGERYDRKNDKRINRWGSNPGSVRIGQERVKIRVPRIRDEETEKEVPLESYNYLKEAEPDEENLLKGIIHGLSMKDYHEVVRQFEEGYGLSRSSVSNYFKEQSAQRVEAFFTRDLSAHEFVALFIDGKYLAGQQILIVLGITSEGNKIVLGFAQATTENSTCIKELFSEILQRGFKYEHGILCVVDGSKGLKKAIEDTFGDYAVIKRCAWHKRENMISYLPDSLKKEYKKKFDRAYVMTDFTESHNSFIDLSNELAKVNISASRSILEGLDELLTLHKLNLIEDFGRSFSTSNIIESLNSQISTRLRNVKNWKNSDMRYRWVATALLEIEPNLKKVANSQKLSILQETIHSEIQKLIKSNKYSGIS